MSRTNLPDALDALLTEISVELPRLLGADFVGLYQYGSLTQDAFVPERSDVDCILVTRRDLTAPQFEALSRWLDAAAQSDPWYQRLQMSILIADQVLTMNAKACLYQFGKLVRTGSDGNPIIWRNVLDSGVTLAGADPETFVPEITNENLARALRLELRYLHEELNNPESEWRDRLLYRAYAVLTVCRIRFTEAEGRVGAKPEAARWALRTLPATWHPLVELALAYQLQGAEVDIDIAQILDFVEDALAELGPGPAA